MIEKNTRMPSCHPDWPLIIPMTTRIVTQTERRLKPPVAALLSLALPGLGEMYAGIPSRGFTLFIARILFLLVAPLYAAIHPGAGGMSIFLFTIASALAVTILSPLQAFLVSLGKKTSPVARYNRPWIYFLLLPAGLALTLAACINFTGTFRPFRLTDSMSPLVSGGDVAILRQPVFQPRPGYLVLYRYNGVLRFSRVIGLPGDRVTYDGGKISVNDSPLQVRIFTGDQARRLGIAAGEDVVAEENGGVLYPITTPGAPGKKTVTCTAGTGEIILLDDRRNGPEKMITVSPGEMEGRVDGILYSPSGKHILIPPYIRTGTE